MLEMVKAVTQIKSSAVAPAPAITINVEIFNAQASTYASAVLGLQVVEPGRAVGASQAMTARADFRSTCGT